MAINLPVVVVATILTFVYGLSISHAWLPALIQAAITCVCVLLGGLFYAGIGQIVGIFVSSVIIFAVFVLPEQKRRAKEETEKARKAKLELNEEDK